MELLLLTRRCFALAMVLFLAGCTGVFFQPYKQLVRSPNQIGLAFEDVWFEADDDVRLHGWYLPAVGKACGSILFLHGNAENISTHIGSVYWMPARGFNVFMPDYRGYGLSEGRPSLSGIEADIHAATRYLLGRAKEDGRPIAIFGQSLGGAAVIYYAAHTSYKSDIRALVIESAFASHRDIAREKLAGFWLTWPLSWPLSFTISDTYSPLAAVPNVSPIPLLLVYGDRDTIVPISHGERLYQTAQEPKEFWRMEGVGHIGAFHIPHESNRDRLVAYLRSKLCPN